MFLVVVRPFRSRGRLVAIAALWAVALSSAQLFAAAQSAPSAHAGPKSMVALGDSYASGPVIPPQTEQPWGCLRSSNNYAHQVARELDLDLTDVTCSGASTKHMWERHGVSPEEELSQYGSQFGYNGYPGNPPQLDALRPNTDIVTLQIGGEHNRLLTLAPPGGR